MKDRVIVKESNLNISIPSPINFCLHKLLIAQRREIGSKRLKDIEQAVYVLDIVDLKQFRNKYKELPKKWKKYIFQSMEEARIQIPLKEDIINKAILTLQK